MNDTQLFKSISNCDHWQDSFEESLRAYKFLEPKKAWKNIITLSSQSNFQRLFPKFFKSLIKLILTCGPKVRAA